MSDPRTATKPRLDPPPLPRPDQAWALFLDVDGTLVGFAEDPDEVRVPTPLRTTLVSLHALLDGALALVSGRRLYDLDRLFGPPLVAAAGLHGLQRRRGDGSEDSSQPDVAQVDAMHREVAALAVRLPHLRVEDKGTCMALHFREAPAIAAAVADAANRIVDGLSGYDVQPGNRVVEIKPAGMDKGRAVAAFLAEPPFAGRVPVYVGDDLTDEHAFTTVNARGGISIRVGDRAPTRARCTLSDPAAVDAWLQRVLASFGGEASR